ncbi:MAG: hypothetical protein J7L46_03605 [Bacteroidales bacterium]|nr:hypothetical protein [Bacteroidales bacterium]
MATFDPFKDNIAVVVKNFKMKKKSESFLDRYSEPYIISMAVDQDGAHNPAVDFNVMPFPHVRKGDTVSFDGQGHLIYGPANPKEFLVYSILFMESDKDIRAVGEKVESVIKSEAVKMGAKALLLANPTYATAISLLQKFSGLVASEMKKNKDDELFRRNGTLLRDVIPAYDILRTYESENDFIKTNIGIIPLSASNHLGEQTKKIQLD